MTRILESVDGAKVLDENFESNDPSAKGVVEVAVKMRQFPASRLLSVYLSDGVLKTESLKRLSFDLAEFHLSVKTAVADGDFGGFDAVINPVHANLRVLDQLTLPEPLELWLEQHRAWIKRIQPELAFRFKERLNAGAIRECHGDLHVGNIHLNNDERLEV